jgi:hypothetical protein
MSDGWFLVPYHLWAVRRGRPVVAVALQELSPRIYGEGGFWRETQVLGGHAIVVVGRASDETLGLVESTPGVVPFPRVPLDARIGDATTAADRRALADVVRGLGYTRAELLELLGDDATVARRRLLEVLAAIARRRRTYTYDARSGAVSWDGRELPPNPLPLAAGGAPQEDLLDNFNRADAGSLGANWPGHIYTGQANLGIISNTARNTASPWGDNYWTTVFAEDHEVGVTITTLPGNTNAVDLYARLVALGVPDGYSFGFDQSSGTDQLHVNRVDDGNWTMLGSATGQNMAVGDAIALVCDGSDISGWRKPNGGVWAQLAGAGGTDATYSGSSRIGLESSGTTARLDNFFGGELAAPPPAVKHLAALGVG